MKQETEACPTCAMLHDQIPLQLWEEFTQTSTHSRDDNDVHTEHAGPGGDLPETHLDPHPASVYLDVVIQSTEPLSCSAPLIMKVPCTLASLCDNLNGRASSCGGRFLVDGEMLPLPGASKGWHLSVSSSSNEVAELIVERTLSDGKIQIWSGLCVPVTQVPQSLHPQSNCPRVATSVCWKVVVDAVPPTFFEVPPTELSGDAMGPRGADKAAAQTEVLPLGSAIMRLGDHLKFMTGEEEGVDPPGVFTLETPELSSEDTQRAFDAVHCLCIAASHPVCFDCGCPQCGFVVGDVCKSPATPLPRRSLARLRHGAWLNDDIVNAWMELMRVCAAIAVLGLSTCLPSILFAAGLRAYLCVPAAGKAAH